MVPRRLLRNLLDHRFPPVVEEGRQARLATASEVYSPAMRMVQVAQHAEDLERATRFYADLLGAEPRAAYDPPGLVFFDVGGVRLLLERGAPRALHYLGVDDVAATVERLRGQGVTVEGEPHVIFTHDDDTLGPAGTEEWMAFVRDSEDNLLGLVEQRPR